MNDKNLDSRASDAVTDDMVERACAAFYSDLAWRTNSNQSRDFMRSALEAALAAQPAPVVGGVGYGIIDPDYARIFTVARVLCWSEGYALTMHGSFTRDLDLVAVPWIDRAREPEHLARRILETCGLKDTAGNPGEKSHGRLVWTMRLPDFGDPRFVDFSVMPPSPLLSARPGGDDPIGWVFQHDETGRTTFCPNDGVNNPDSFAANNPRFVLSGPAYAHPAQAGGEVES